MPGLEMLLAAIAAQGEHAGRRFIKFLTATIHNRNTRVTHARVVKRFVDSNQNSGFRDACLPAFPSPV